ncbi:MAG: hypothetical protein OZ929_08260 [Bryobacterales bacterium]|nr:hypothetical protein [Bryobacterales bacterium]
MLGREPDSDAILQQFNKLIQELLRGNMKRNSFRRWEIDLLLDIGDCNLQRSQRRNVLQRYQKAVQRHMEKGAPTPLKLSEYLETLRARRDAREERQPDNPAVRTEPRSSKACLLS